MNRSEKHGPASSPPPDRTPVAEGLGAPAAPPEAGSSTIWLELFLDLVAVAAMVVLATAFEEHATCRSAWAPS